MYLTAVVLGHRFSISHDVTVGLTDVCVVDVLIVSVGVIVGRHRHSQRGMVHNWTDILNVCPVMYHASLRMPKPAHDDTFKWIFSRNFTLNYPAIQTLIGSQFATKIGDLWRLSLCVVIVVYTVCNVRIYMGMYL